jgi:acyl carrier protein
MTSEMLAKLTDIFRTMFNNPKLNLSRELTAKDVPGWDSFNHVNLMIAVEEEFGLRFSSTEVSNLKNVGELMGLIDAKRG